MTVMPCGEYLIGHYGPIKKELYHPGRPIPISPTWQKCSHKEMWVNEVHLCFPLSLGGVEWIGGKRMGDPGSSRMVND